MLPDSGFPVYRSISNDLEMGREIHKKNIMILNDLYYTTICHFRADSRVNDLLIFIQLDLVLVNDLLIFIQL